MTNRNDIERFVNKAEHKIVSDFRFGHIFIDCSELYTHFAMQCGTLYGEHKIFIKKPIAKNHLHAHKFIGI